MRNAVQILDRHGNPMPAPRRRAASDTSYDGASMTSRELASWQVLATSADAELLPELSTLVARSRDLSRNNGIASSGIQAILDNVVGIGLRLNSTPDYRALGRDKAWADAWSASVEAKWRAWAETTDCDAARTLNFAGLTMQVARAGLLNGEGLALPLWLPSRDRKYATSIQLVEADRLSNPLGQQDSAALRGGIEIDRYGAPQAYWVRNSHPGDLLTWDPGLYQWTKVPAFTNWGRRQVIHVHDRERTGQSRGKPLLSSVLAQFKTLDHYSKAELQAAVVNAMIAAFIKSTESIDDLKELFGGPDEYLAARAEHAVRLKAGAVLPLFPGDEVRPFTPARPAAAFDAFTKSVLRHISAGLNIPYEILMKDFTQTNYSSARAALLEAWRFFNGRRQWLGTYWASPVFELWLEEAVNLGEVEAPDFYQNRYAYSRCRWIGAGKGWVDPVKEAQAAKLRMEIGVSTLEDECAEQGKDWREVMEQQASEQAERRRLGLPLLAQAPKPNGATVDQATPDDQTGDE
ncbi:lambda family phage portal protein [Azospirillum brasilense]|uniref:Lambda family phage portal protein n=1 Tax=Azospirillum brasilense TaxID=192 RepID=A0A560BV08_AZOBR|nr:phage portal protein [Azospirillum brasilense]TWA76438.1 lambda family phage portal protein [Azospirillum brasilense]